MAWPFICDFWSITLVFSPVFTWRQSARNAVENGASNGVPKALQGGGGQLEEVHILQNVQLRNGHRHWERSMIRFMGSPSKEFEPSSRFPVDFFGADVFAVVVLLLLLLFFATSSPAVLFSVRIVRSRNSTVALKGIRPMDLPLCASRKVAAAMIWRVAKSGKTEEFLESKTGNLWWIWREVAGQARSVQREVEGYKHTKKV